MGFSIGAVCGFVFGWLFFKRPELIERAVKWINIKVKELWNKVF